jgi:poly(A) polymerase
VGRFVDHDAPGPPDAPDALASVLAECRAVGERFAAAGHVLYLVGGIVRDLELGRPVDDPDLDLTTDARPEHTRALLDGWAEAIWTQGERFGTIGAQHRGRRFEITTFRAEAYDPDSRKPRVAYADAVEADLSRRDFTVNAMARALPGGERVDPFGGRDDLAARLLRTPLSPEQSFSDDPLRMLRAARFVAGYGLSPVPGVEEAMATMADRMAIVSTERVHDELTKLLRLADPGAGLLLLARTGLARWCLPPLHGLGPAAAETIARQVAAAPPTPAARLAALHLAAAPGSDPAAVERAASAHVRALKGSLDEARTTRVLAGVAARLTSGGAPRTERALREAVLAAGALLDDSLAVAEAVDPGAADGADLARLRALAAREGEGLARPPLDGRAVMARLGLPAGPLVGAALAELHEATLDRGPLTADEAGELLDRWWARQDPGAG